MQFNILLTSKANNSQPAVGDVIVLSLVDWHHRGGVEVSWGWTRIVKCFSIIQYKHETVFWLLFQEITFYSESQVPLWTEAVISKLV